MSKKRGDKPEVELTEGGDSRDLARSHPHHLAVGAAA